MSEQCQLSTDLDLNSYKGKYVVLYFYPRDSTPGCTQEAQDFTKLKKKFSALNAAVIGVSRDSLKSHENFIKKFDLDIQLVSDPDEILCRKFDVIKEKNMYGKKVEGIERSTFIIDPKGRIIQEWRKVKVAGHAETVLNWLKDYIKTSQS